MMIVSRKLKCLSLFSSMVVFAVLATECSSQRTVPLGSWDPVHVSVANDISEGVELHIHCRSKEDDLGEHTLTYGNQFDWKFRIDLFVRTLFSCNMSWTDVDGKLVRGGYAMYNAERDWYRCENQCHFSVRKDCVYGYFKAKDAFECVYRFPGKAD
ncbi:hypothetical protein MKW94_017423 [Papaver nudicaule]|uniref:S-protein homolog n=1 Tax=Papaver nudicaule TaxID=74823 RepID=A0AA42B273_PAPNU|nr:hypothetical protein [Papaver nudicaule]